MGAPALPPGPLPARRSRWAAVRAALEPPAAPPSPPLRPSQTLLAVVTAISLGAAILAAVTIRSAPTPPEAVTIAIASACIAVVTAYSVMSFGGTGGTAFSASAFLLLGLTLAVGPLGSLMGAAAHAATFWKRLHTGWIRTAFNFSNYFLSSMSALAVASALHVGPHSGNAYILGCTAAGGALFVCNEALLAVVVIMSSKPRISILEFFGRTKHAIPYNVGYGVAGYAFSVMYAESGPIGFVSVLTPILLLQTFLVFWARKAEEHQQMQLAHSKEREALLESAISASEDERKRIASDLHDGVVQTLAGLALSLSAAQSEEQRKELVPEAADVLRTSVTELRTLMIAIAPPDLDKTGIDVAIDRLMAPLRAKGMEVDVNVPKALHLTPQQTTLVFRVAQEATRNILNHSRATRVSVELSLNGKISLQLSDNGRGFSNADRERRRQEGHMGLSLLTKAVESAGGELSLHSTPGEGTSLMLALP